METPIPITAGTGSASVAADLVSGNSYQQIKVVDGTVGGNTPLIVNADGSITASVYGSLTVTPPANQSVSGTIGASIIGVVPVSFAAASNQSVSGTVGASIIGVVPITGAIAASISGIVVNQPFPTSSLVSGVTSVITGTTSVQVLAPAPTSQRNYITNVLVTNAAAAGTTVQLFDGGNVIYTGFAAASGGGFSAAFPVPLRQSSIAGNLSALSTVQASVYVSASGYTAP